jgi:hypothetical protein
MFKSQYYIKVYYRKTMDFRENPLSSQEWHFKLAVWLHQ